MYAFFSVDHRRMRAEFFVDIVMRSLPEQILVKLANTDIELIFFFFFRCSHNILPALLYNSDYFVT